MIGDSSIALLNRFVLIVLLASVVAALPAVANTAGSVTCRIDVGEYRILEQNDAHLIRVDGFGRIGVVGAPGLPGKIVAVAIPPGAQATGVRVEGPDPVELEGVYRIEPLPLPRLIGEPKPDAHGDHRLASRAAQDKIYGTDQGYPSSPGWLVKKAGFRKYNLVDVQVAPFRYHPQTGRLFRYPRLTIHVDYTFPPGPVAPAMIDNIPEMELTAREIVLNYDEAQAWYPAAPGSREPAPYDFVVIVRESMVQSVMPLIPMTHYNFRNPKFVTVEWIYANYSGVDGAERIRNFLRDKYPSSEWGIRDVLLAGNVVQVPMRLCWVDGDYGLQHPRSDFYFAELSETDQNSWDLDGDGLYGEVGDDVIDHYTEVNVGRIPWGDDAVMHHICEKSMNFQLNDDEEYKKSILCLGSFFWADTDTAWLMEAKLAQPWMADWHVTRMYEQNTTVQSNFGCDCPLYHGNSVPEWATGKYCFVNSAGHGSPTSTHMMGYNSQAYIMASDCIYLSDDRPAIVWSDACSNNDTNRANIGREMLKHGAVGFVGATSPAFGAGAWNEPEDGSSQTCDYWFTSKVTSREMTQGEAHQWSLRKLYTDGLWYQVNYEMFIWTLYGVPTVGLGSPVAE